MIAEIVAIGTELVSGQSLDTNSQWLSRSLGALGISVHFHTGLGDDLAENIAALQIACARADLVITSGGLGPTQDDLTREALADVAGVPLVEDAESLAAIAAMFARRNRPMAERNRVQALRPEGAETLPNSVGSAPGIWMTIGRSRVACLPGVPHELKRMFSEQVVPRLHSLGAGSRVIVHRKINLFGRGESEIEAQALDLTARGRVPEVGITASEATISFRIVGEGATEADALAQIEPTAAIIYDRFGQFIVGEGSDDVVDSLVHELLTKKTTLAVAESCTGGLIAHEITSLPGVSEVFPGGVVSYANAAKVDLLGVPPELLNSHGAVSPEVAEAMAIGVRERFHADIGLSVTGVAGPSGGTLEKPVGLVYLGLATANSVESRRLEIGPEQPREVIQRRSAKNAMNWVRLKIKGVI
jgi:nicotinamide-nucleotide amidase